MTARKRGKESHPALDHVRRHLAQGWAEATIERAAEIPEGSVSRALNQQGKLDEDLARALRAVDHDRLIATAQGRREVPARVCRWMIGSLWAMGWSTTQQATQLGYPVGHLQKIMHGVTLGVSREFYDDLEMLHDRLARTQGPSQVARLTAARHGYQEPSAYAHDGTLWADARAERDEADAELAARRDREAIKRLELVRVMLAHKFPSIQHLVNALEAEHPVTMGFVMYVRRELGLRYAASGQYETGLEPGQEEAVARMRDVIWRWQHDPTGDPHRYCVELGMMTSKNWTRTSQSKAAAA